MLQLLIAALMITVPFLKVKAYADICASIHHGHQDDSNPGLNPLNASDRSDQHFRILITDGFNYPNYQGFVDNVGGGLELLEKILTYGIGNCILTMRTEPSYPRILPTSGMIGVLDLWRYDSTGMPNHITNQTNDFMFINPLRYNPACRQQCKSETPGACYLFRLGMDIQLQKLIDSGFCN